MMSNTVLNLRNMFDKASVLLQISTQSIYIKVFQETLSLNNMLIEIKHSKLTSVIWTFYVYEHGVIQFNYRVLSSKLFKEIVYRLHRLMVAEVSYFF